MQKDRKLKLGQILLDDHLITKSQLEKALELQETGQKRIGQILVDEKFVTEEDIALSLSKQLHIPFLTEKSGLLRPKEDQNLHKLIPENFALQNIIVPLSKEMNSLTVALFDPLNIIVLDNIENMTKCKINPVIATKTDIESVLGSFYGSIGQFEKLVRNLGDVDVETIELTQEQLNINDAIEQAEEAPVIKLVNMLILQAIRDKASDIHIEPFYKRLRIRYRIDGILYDIPSPGMQLYLPLVSRIKIISKLDIAEKRLPQDGSFHLRVEDRMVDVRTSTMPTVWGEKVVMRILDKNIRIFDLKNLGFEKEEVDLFQKEIQRPYGLVLVTGPTGSGKSTTLYGALNHVKSDKYNVLTIEDPVEYKIEGINQSEVNPEIGYSFAEGLRHALRQDPDMIMVGEVRDLETAEICVRSALTGHMVFSTLHTNDATSAITRLVDIGIQPFLVMSSVTMIVAQRLIRKLCEKCKEEYKPTAKMIEDLGFKGVKKLYRPKGCSECRNIGYSGRQAIYEIFVVNETIKRMIAEGKNAQEIKEVAVNEFNMRSLYKAALEKVKKGVTSVEEAYTITRFDV